MSKDSFQPLKKLTSKIGSGATPSGGQANYKKSGISLIRSQNVLDMSFSKDGLAYIDDLQAKKLNNVEVYENDVLINITGDSIARVCKVPLDILPARVNQHVSILRCNDLLDPGYLLYYLIYKKDYLLTISRVGGTRNALTKEAIEKLEIRIDKNQQKIAAVLSALDDKIELNNMINTELEAMAKILYDYWFVQFDFTNADGKPYKSSGGKMEYNPILKREIPEGWEVKRLSQIANITMGQSPSGESYNEETNGMIFFQGSTDFGWRYPENRVYTTSPTRFAKEDDLLLSVRAPIGTMNLALNNCCIGRGLAALNSKGNYNSYLIYQMNYFKKKFDYLNSVGTTFGSLTKDELYNLELVYPSNDILNNFEKVVSGFDAKIKSNCKQNQELAQLRDWLLPMLMNGQVRVE